MLTIKVILKEDKANNIYSNGRKCLYSYYEGLCFNKRIYKNKHSDI